MYNPKNKSDQIKLKIRGLEYNINCWGDSTKPLVLILHGWADMGISFQFLADEMAENWYLVAPDWRGFGDTQWNRGGYWFPDYLGDLEALIDYFSPLGSVRLVGHSMGGNIAWLYAGIRQERISHTVSLDSFGLPDSLPQNATSHYAMWLDQIKQTQKFSNYADIEAVTERIMQLAPKLDLERAGFLANYWSKKDEEGLLHLKHDPIHKRINPVLYRRLEVESCWRSISAKVLLVLAKESSFYKLYEREKYREKLNANFITYTERVIEGTGHMLHLEQPLKLSSILDNFLRQ